MPKRRRQLTNDRLICVADAKNSSRAASLGVEDSREVTLPPLVRWRPWPTDDIFDGDDRGPGRRANSRQGLLVSDCFMECEFIGRDTAIREVQAGSAKRLEVDESKSETVDVVAGPARAGSVRIVTDMTVTADHAAEVTPSIVRVVVRRQSEPTRAHQLVLERQMRAAKRPPLRPSHMFPATIAQESVIAAGQEFGPVLQRHPVCRLYRRPLVEHIGDDVTAIGAAADGPVDVIARAHVADRLRPTIAHQDRNFTAYAIRTRMTASPVRVDRVLEGDGRPRADLVDDRAGAHVEELEAAELTGADLALGHVEQRLLRGLLVVVGELPPELSFRHGRERIEQVFDHARVRQCRRGAVV